MPRNDIKGRHLESDPEIALDRFFELSLDMLCVAHADGYFKRLNPAFSRTLGWSIEELLRRPFLDFVHPDDQEATLAEVERQVMRGDPVINFENRYLHQDGSWRTLAWMSIPQPDGMLYATARDVTEERAMQEAVRVLNTELNRQAILLEAANKELEAFCYSVSHDLRAPLRSIDGFSQALLEDYSHVVDDEGRDYINRVRAATQRMGQLIDDLLDLSRVSRTEMRQQLVDLSQISRSVCADLAVSDPHRRVEVAIADGLMICGDQRLLSVVMENLLRNAWKFSSKREGARIEVGRTDDAKTTEFYVKDNGAGFDPAYADKLFGAFQRLHAMDEFPGTGVGLATVARIIHRHGGRVRAEGVVGQGATFYFSIEHSGGLTEQGSEKQTTKAA